MQRTMGVYTITNMDTGKSYVGASTWVEQRLEQHRAMIAAGCHPNPRLRGAAKYSGVNRFRFKLVEAVSDVSLLAPREQAWIRRLDAVENGYNRTYRTDHFDGRGQGYRPSVMVRSRRGFWRRLRSGSMHGLHLAEATLGIVLAAVIFLVVVAG